MRIQSIYVQRFRSIYAATLNCDFLTALVGANGAGKSTFLRALDVFYKPVAPIESYDFYGNDITKPISITVTYTDLSDIERQYFADFVQANNLKVEKRIQYADNNKFTQIYYGWKQQHDGFTPLRSLAKATERGELYKELRNQQLYTDLPKASNDQNRLDALRQWEQNHQEACDFMEIVHPFFGERSSNHAKLEHFSKFLLIPAVRDVTADTTDARGSVINELVDMVVRRLLNDNPEVHRLQEQAETTIRKVIDLASLDDLNKQLNRTLVQLTPNTNVELKWADLALKMPLPQVNINVCEDAYPTHISRTGHGVQRSFIITLLQHLAMTNIPRESSLSANQSSTIPNLVLAVEEPELFQHPSRQRHFAAILSDLSQGHIPGVATSTQVIYCTHSPYFVDIDRFEQVRVIAKKSSEDTSLPKQSQVRLTTKANLQAANPKLDHSRLASTLTPAVNEGFFAHVAVLVEGEGDRAVLQAYARYKYGKTLEAMGVSVISAQGNDNICKPLVIFNQLGIKTYTIWDSDKDKIGTSAETTAIRINRELLALCENVEEDWPEGVHRTHAIFSPKLEDVLQREVEAHGINWIKLLDECEKAIGNKKLKSYPVLWYIVETACSRGCQFPTIHRILEQIEYLSQT